MTKDEVESEIHQILGMRNAVIERTRNLVDRMEQDEEEVMEQYLDACCMTYFQLASTGDVIAEIASESDIPVEFLQRIADELPTAWKAARILGKVADIMKKADETEDEWPEVVQEKVEIPATRGRG